MKATRLFTDKGTYTAAGRELDDISTRKLQIVLKYYKQLMQSGKYSPMELEYLFKSNLDLGMAMIRVTQ